MKRNLVALALAGGAISALILAACTGPEVERARGRDLFMTYCQGCHGASGKGDGPAAPALGKKPADLTTLAARNGGEFPLIRVMSVIDGYTRRNDHGSIMPEMGPAIETGPTVMLPGPDGQETPVPQGLLDLARYVETLQTK